MSLDFIYDTPNAILLLIFILVFLSLALIGLYIFTLFTGDGFNKRFDNNNTSIYVAVVATAMAIIVAFIITGEYQNYQTTALNLAREANSLASLIGILVAFDSPEARAAIVLTIKYLCSIINSEFVLMEEGILPGQNQCLDNLQLAILTLDPTTSKQTVLYDKAIDQLNLAINLRNYRLEQTVATLPEEFYWLLIIGISILIVLTWFVNSDPLYKVIMVSFVTIIYSTLIFLVVILDRPFRSFFALDASPFQLTLNELGVTTCPSEGCAALEVNNTEFLKHKVSNYVKSSTEINLI